MRLSLRVQKMCLCIATLSCMAGALAVMVWAVRALDVPSSTPRQRKPAIETSNGTTGQTHEPAREEFAKLCQRPLRRPLYDPPPPRPEVKQIPPLRVELLGTILEDANSVAIVRSEQGSVQYKRIGDAIGPTDNTAKVLEISANAIVVERAQQRLTLKVQAKELR